jgi:transcriptional regulator with XRE-family HTH domain
MMMKLGGRLRELREEMGLSQAQLAGHAEVSQGYLCQLEREEVKNPSAAILLRLAKALYVDPHEQQRYVLLLLEGMEDRVKPARRV